MTLGRRAVAICSVLASVALEPLPAHAFWGCTHCEINKGAFGLKNLAVPECAQDRMCIRGAQQDHCDLTPYRPGDHFDRLQSDAGGDVVLGTDVAYQRGMSAMCEKRAELRRRMEMEPPDCKGAQLLLAELLHAAQDLAIHSNFCDEEDGRTPLIGPSPTLDDRVRIGADMINCVVRTPPASLRLQATAFVPGSGGAPDCFADPVGDPYPHPEHLGWETHFSPSSCLVSQARVMGAALVSGIMQDIGPDGMRRLLDCPDCDEGGFGSSTWKQKLSCARSKYENITSDDPNSMSAVSSGLLSSVVSPNGDIHVAVDCENKASASAPAHTIRIVMPISEALIDVSRIEVVAIAIGDTVVAFQDRTLPAHVDIDMRPRHDVIASVDVHWDPYGRRVLIYEESLDPLSREPVENPLVGILPANRVPPEGQQTVWFAVKAGPNVDGAAIRFAATIVFDANAAIETNEAIVIGDGRGPSADIRLSRWDGIVHAVPFIAEAADPSGVDRVMVSVSRNGGAPTNILSGSPGEYIYVAQEPGEYCMFIAAEDSAGNVAGSGALADTCFILSGPTGTRHSPTIIAIACRDDRLSCEIHADVSDVEIVIQESANGETWRDAGALVTVEGAGRWHARGECSQEESWYRACASRATGVECGASLRVGSTVRWGWASASAVVRRGTPLRLGLHAGMATEVQVYDVSGRRLGRAIYVTDRSGVAEISVESICGTILPGIFTVEAMSDGQRSLCKAIVLR